ncbi:hypothetical protein AB1M95_17975 [Sulfitobacter sp. LCG007]
MEIELFRRQSTGAVLTEPGCLFHRRALQIEATWHSSLTELNIVTKGLGGKLRIIRCLSWTPSVRKTCWTIRG